MRLESNGIRLMGNMKENISVEEFYSSSYLQSVSLNSIHFNNNTNDLSIFLFFQIILSIESTHSLSLNNYNLLSDISDNRVINSKIKKVSMKMFNRIEMFKDKIKFNGLVSLDLSYSIDV